MDLDADNQFPFEVLARLDSGLYGVWDRRSVTWAAPPEHEQKACAERLAKFMIEAYAAGYADGVIATVHSPAGRAPFPKWPGRSIRGPRD